MRRRLGGENGDHEVCKICLSDSMPESDGYVLALRGRAMNLTLSFGQSIEMKG